MQILRTDYKGKGRFKSVAVALNAIGRVINDAIGEHGIDVRYEGGRWIFASRPSNSAGLTPITFDVVPDGADRGKLEVLHGSVVWHGHGVYDHAGTGSIAFTGGVPTAPQFLFVEFTWATGAIAIGIAEEYPETDVDKYRHVLVEGYLDERDDPIPDVSVVTFIHHHGDIHIATAFA
jgi:hypothetical protein